MPEIERPDGARIHYQEFGAGTPVLLLAPGGASGEAESWEGEPHNPLQALGNGFRLICVDQRHTGHGSAPIGPFSYEQHALDVLAVLDELGVARAHVLGSGIGAAQALRLAWQAPERIAGAVVQRPPGRDTANTLGDFLGRFDEAMRLPRADGLEGVVAAAERDPRFSHNPGAGPFVQPLKDDQAFRDQVLALRRERYIAEVVRFRDGVWPDGPTWFSVTDDQVARLAVPLLVLPGDDVLSPEGAAKSLAAAAPRTRLLEADHADPGKRDATVRTIVAFLADTPLN